MPFKNEHSVRIKQPSGYSRYRRKNLSAGIDAIIGFKKGGGSEIQALRFDKDKYTPAEAEAWAKKQGYKHPLEVAPAKSSDHMSVASVVVRSDVKNVTDLEINHTDNYPDTWGGLYGQADPGEGMGYIKTPVIDNKDPQDDIPAGQSSRVLAMPQPIVQDPKGSLTNIIPGQKAKMDDEHTIDHEDDVTYWEEEENNDPPEEENGPPEEENGPEDFLSETKDPTGITYGTSASPYNIEARKPRYGLQRSIPSAY